MTSLLGHLPVISGLDGSPQARALVKREAKLLRELLGSLTKDSDVVDGFTATVLGTDWSICHARIFVCWIAGAEKDRIDGDGEIDVVPWCR